MDKQKSLLTQLGETYDRYRAERRAASAEEVAPQSKRHSRVGNFLRWLMPNGGTLLLVALLILTQNVWAGRIAAPSASSVTTIPYQGRLADVNGDPVTGRVNMEFRLYDVPTGGTPLWEEFWTGGNSVNVSDGLFSVMLGSINPTLIETVQGHSQLYLEITVGTDDPMEPRVQLGSVPFSVWSLSVADNSITADKIASGAVGSDEIATDAVGSDEIATDAVGSDEIATDAVGSDEIATDAVGSDEIATDAVGSDEIANASITTDKIGNGAVTSMKMAPTFFQTRLNADTELSAIDPDRQVMLNLPLSPTSETTYLVFASITSRHTVENHRVLCQVKVSTTGERLPIDLCNSHPIGNLNGTQSTTGVGTVTLQPGEHTLQLLCWKEGGVTQPAYLRSLTQLIAIPFSPSP